uniref:Uncharacterized protein n=1 Tax=Arundo donax TaxID=35708 RepID=A0A0A9EDI3_ARUDO
MSSEVCYKLSNQEEHQDFAYVCRPKSCSSNYGHSHS